MKPEFSRIPVLGDSSLEDVDTLKTFVPAREVVILNLNPVRLTGAAFPIPLILSNILQKNTRENSAKSLPL